IADPLLPVAQPLRRTAPQDNPSPAPTVTQPGEPTAEEPSGREVVPTVAERLMARPLPALLELPRSATVEAAARLRGEVATFNDSITEVQNRGALPSWTAAESDGDRWGFSPGRIHLGRHTVSPCEDFALLRITVVLDPFTCQFRMQDAHRRELRDRVDLHREIQIRSGLIEADEQVRRRIRARNARAAAARDTIPR